MNNKYQLIFLTQQDEKQLDLNLRGNKNCFPGKRRRPSLKPLEQILKNKETAGHQDKQDPRQHNYFTESTGHLKIRFFFGFHHFISQ